MEICLCLSFSFKSHGVFFLFFSSLVRETDRHDSLSLSLVMSLSCYVCVYLSLSCRVCVSLSSCLSLSCRVCVSLSLCVCLALVMSLSLMSVSALTAVECTSSCFSAYLCPCTCLSLLSCLSLLPLLFISLLHFPSLFPLSLSVSFLMWNENCPLVLIYYFCILIPLINSFYLIYDFYSFALDWSFCIAWNLHVLCSWVQCVYQKLTDLQGQHVVMSSCLAKKHPKKYVRNLCIAYFWI